MKSVEFRVKLIEASWDLVNEGHNLLFMLAHVGCFRGLVFLAKGLPGSVEVESVCRLVNRYAGRGFIDHCIDDFPKRSREGEKELSKAEKLCGEVVLDLGDAGKSPPMCVQVFRRGDFEARCPYYCATDYRCKRKSCASPKMLCFSGKRLWQNLILLWKLTSDFCFKIYDTSGSTTSTATRINNIIEECLSNFDHPMKESVNDSANR